MASPCDNCGSITSPRKYFSWRNGKPHASCHDCQWRPLTPMYDDIFLGSSGGIKYDENICDPKTGREIPFVTKQDKAIAMKIAGVRQADSAERQHGARNEMYLHRKVHFEVG